MKYIQHQIKAEQICERLTCWIHAVEAKDVERISANYAPKICPFEAIISLQFCGIEGYTQNH